MSGSLYAPSILTGPVTDPNTGQVYPYLPGTAPIGIPPMAGGTSTGIYNGGTIAVTPYSGTGWSNSNTPSTPGWFYNSQTRQLEYSNGAGQPSTSTAPNAQGQQVPGLGGIVNPALNSASSALTWIEELAIRAMMVLVGIVLLGGGIYVAGQRAANARTIPQLARAPFDPDPAPSVRAAGRTARGIGRAARRSIVSPI